MAGINEIDIRKPITISETTVQSQEDALETLGFASMQDAIKELNLNTPERINQFTMFVNHSFVCTDLELKIEVPEAALFVQLMRENEQLSNLIIHDGELQCIAVDMDGFELLHSQFRKEKLITVLSNASHPLLKKIHDTVNAWDWENKFITVEFYRCLK